MTRGGAPGPHIHWDEQERQMWNLALEEEARPRLQGGIGTIAEIAAAAMKHMDRKRPIVSAITTEASVVFHRLRRAQGMAPAATKLRAKPQPSPATTHRPAEPARIMSATEAAARAEPEPQPAPQPQQPAAPDARVVHMVREAPKEAAFEPDEKPLPPFWFDLALGAAEVVARFAIEATTMYCESPAVRKAWRSLRSVIVDTAFQPEIDNTTPWVRPAFGPKLPAILVAGTRKGAAERDITKQFGNRLELRYWRVDETMNQLRNDAKTADKVIIVSGSGIAHKAQYMIKKISNNWMFSSGLAMLHVQLEEIASRYEAERGQNAGAR